ncbi:ABC transporter ATP-binding protein [Paracoccus sp. S3-43]|uniref:ATP-binding cassette domain-containing protein n=1 Tax=Paracoccus sp. S3-43 TaxID=3030011 RepID=UPI0023AEDAEB|nr:ABC transporter ATP-binding protein [Paracoccus sp. S3-43]WEF25579.1 ABC transporter ATP-binding protein [Paracoccus sp. S3-43]
MDRVTPLIEARDLAIGHAGRALITGIDLSLPPGRVLCLLGPNGAGKTTLFRTLLGLIPPIRGTVALSGQPLSGLSRARIARHIAHVPQSLTTPFAFTARDIVLMGAAARLGPFARPARPRRGRRWRRCPGWVSPIWPRPPSPACRAASGRWS